MSFYFYFSMNRLKMERHTFSNLMSNTSHRLTFKVTTSSQIITELKMHIHYTHERLKLLEKGSLLCEDVNLVVTLPAKSTILFDPKNR